MSAIQREGVGMLPFELFQRTLFQSATLPWKSIYLEPTTLEDYGRRATSPRMAVGELYHQNSKLYPQHQALVAAPVQSRRETRIDFVARRAQAAESTEPPAGTESLLVLIRQVAEAQKAEVLFGIELRLVVANCLYSCEPRSCRLRLIRELEPEKLAQLDWAIEPGEASARPSNGQAIMAVIGSFARNEILLGSRGYRRTALDVGRFVGALETAAPNSGHSIVTPVLEFYDRVLDAIVEVDGLEQGTLALLIVGGLNGSREGQA